MLMIIIYFVCMDGLREKVFGNKKGKVTRTYYSTQVSVGMYVLLLWFVYLCVNAVVAELHGRW